MRTESPDSVANCAGSPAVRRWFLLAAVLASLWFIVLSVFSLLTANPVTLNRDQILDATDVLTAVVEDVKSGQVRVEKTWKWPAVVHDEKLTLSNLAETKPVMGERLLIPVTSARDGWHVTRSKLPDESPLVYPANEDSERQLRHLLKTGRLP